MPLPLPVLPEDNQTICLVIPDSNEFRQIYMGALQLLAQWWYWDVQYANEAFDVIQRVQECAYLTSRNYYGCQMIDCQEIIDCINDPSTGVADAIANVAFNRSAESARDVAQSYNDSSLGDGSNPTCDDDILFGQCLQLVEYLHSLNLDALEVIEVASNPNEFVATVVGSVSGADEASVDAVFQWGEFVIDSISENYLAQVTQLYLEDRACEIFCIAKNNNCKIDPTTLFEVWRARLNATVSITSLINESLLYLVSGVWVGQEIADFMFFSQLAIRSQLGEFFGKIAYSDLDMRLRIYGNDPNPDWQVLCPPCVPTWCVLYDFSNPDGVVNEICGTTNSQTLTGDGLLCAGAYTAFTRFDISSFTVTKIEVSMTLTGNNPAFRKRFVAWDNGAVVINESINPASQGTDVLVWEDVNGITIDELLIDCRYGTTTTPPTGDNGVINYVRIEGKGSNPFINGLPCP